MPQALKILLSLFALTIGLTQNISHAEPASKGSPALRDSLCLNVKFSQGQPLAQLPMLADLGVGWVRDNVDWPTLEPAINRYVGFPKEFEQRLSYYREHDIGVVFLLAYGNAKVYPESLFGGKLGVPAEPFARYALHVAKLMRASGVRFVLEIGNEPHNWLGSMGGNWQGKPPSPWLDHYLSMVRSTVKTVKAFDPNITLLTDDDMWIVHYWFMEGGLPPDIDGFAIHPYAARPERAAVNHDTDWTRPFQVVDENGSFASALRRLREQARKKLGREPEIWITEWGWEHGGKKPDGGRFSEEEIAAYLVRAYVLAAANGVPHTCWFSAQDSVDGPMGLIDNQGRIRRAYAALKNLALELGDYRFEAQVQGQNTPTSGPQAFLFRHPESGARKTVHWNSDNSQAPQIRLTQ